MMILKATAQKESPKQSLSNFTSEAAVCICSSKTSIIKNFVLFTVKHLCWSLFLIELHALWPAISFQPHPKKTSTQVIPVKIANF